MKYKNLINRMTLEEKASLMSGKDYWKTKDIERFNIKSMFLADGSYGIRKQIKPSDKMGLNQGKPATCFPAASTISNSWNEVLAEKVGQYLGDEAVDNDINVLLGPAINIKRSPLCGRNFEYFSEDPYLTGKLAAAYIRGIQSNGIAACVKHFAVNNQEKRRMVIDTIVDERTLREIYLTAFEIAIKEGKSKAIMTSYNKVNGTYANENEHLLKDILKNEWDFKGCVITDWGGCNDRILGLKAGNNLEMPGNSGETDKEIIDAINNGILKEEVLDEAVDRLLELIFTTSKSLGSKDDKFNIEKHHRIAQRVAEESIVLLKNEDDMLPIKNGKKVAVIGNFAKEARYQGSGSALVNPTILDNTLECFEESGIASIGYEEGFERYGKKNEKKKARACNLAKKADVVLLYVGLDEFAEVEGIDRETMALPQNQVDLLEAIYEVNKNIVVIISCGSVIEMPWINKVKGVVHGYLSGQAGARSVLRILSGDVNPSGKLTETFPIKYDDTPCANYFPGREVSVEYREGIYVGYRYYDTAEKNVLFPFGYGLSYTTFEYSNLEIKDDCVSFTVANVGDVAGMEVAELYISCKSEKIFRPKKELKGFAKVFINPKEEKEITLYFNDKTFRYFDVKTNKWEIEQADYEIMIGSSSRDIKLKGCISINGTTESVPYEKDKIPSYYGAMIKNVSLNEFEDMAGLKAPERLLDKSRDLSYNDTVEQCKYAKGFIARCIYYIILLSCKFNYLIGRRHKANVIKVFILDMPFRGISKMTGNMISKKMLDNILLIVNGRLFKGIIGFKKMKKSKDRKKL